MRFSIWLAGCLGDDRLSCLKAGLENRQAPPALRMAPDGFLPICSWTRQQVLDKNGWHDETASQLGASWCLLDHLN